MLFFSIFMPLFAIASVIFLIKLATYTAVIKLSVWEMTKLYLFILPEIFFYTLPITFFIAATLSLSKLSNDNEMTVIFALGIKPSFILKTLFKPAFILSAVLVFDFFVMFPHATVLSTNFLRYKTSEAKFNLSASEFGHNFGSWLLYIGKENANGTYGDVFLFHKEKKEELLIGAKEAEVINDSGVLRLKLSKGQGYTYSSDSLNQMNFSQMYINDVMKTNLREYHAPIDFWLDEDRAQEKKRMFITDTLMALFPLLALFIISSIGIVHARHNKSHVYLYIFLTLFGYYAATLGLQAILSFYTIPIVIISFLIVSLIIYKKTILNRF